MGITRKLKKIVKSCIRNYSDDSFSKNSNKPTYTNKLKESQRKPLKLHGVPQNLTIDSQPKKSKDNGNKGDNEKLKRELIHRIKLSGPLTVAQYMQEVLTNPLSGYYISSKVFGTQGDFITSPEISQMFGESIAIWLLNEWIKMGKPKPMNIVELGPGKGTLMQDVCRTLFKLAPKDVTNEHVSIHLVEVSQQMRQLQESTLCGYFHGHSHNAIENDSKNNVAENTELYEHKAIGKYGNNIYWYPRIEDVPNGFTFYLAHEFFDALPIHKFVKNLDGEWREVLIDIDINHDNDLRFVQAKFSTPAVKLIDENSICDKCAIELSPKTGVIVQHISNRIDEYGGGALIADYGNNKSAEDSFRAFKNHKLHDVLKDPGTADLTADVDFSYIRSNCSEHTLSYGPVSQKTFLHSLGIDVRYKKLSEHVSTDKSDLKAAYHVLTDEDKMGERFKFFSIFPKTMKPIHEKYPPIGFEYPN